MAGNSRTWSRLACRSWRRSLPRRSFQRATPAQTRTGNRGLALGAGKCSLDRTVREIRRIERKVIMVQPLVIPRRAGTVIAEIQAAHCGGAREPSAGWIDTLATA